MLHALLLSALVSQPTATVMGSDPFHTYFEARLDKTGIPQVAVSAWPFSSIPAPSIQWLGNDPTGAGGISSHAFSASGSPTTGIETPFCPSGNYSDLGECLEAVRFTHATNDYYIAPNTSLGNIADDTPWSMCFVTRMGYLAPDYYTVAWKGGAWGVAGWLLYSSNSNRFVLLTDGSGGPNVSCYTGPFLVSTHWGIGCFAFDGAGNGRVISNNGTPSSCTAQHAGVSNSTAMRIGQNGSSSYAYSGDITSIYIWESTMLTDDQMIEFVNTWEGVNELNGAPAINAGYGGTVVSACWIDGLLEGFGSSYPRIGCQAPPGTPGAGTPTSGGYFAQPLRTNVLKGSRLQNANWTESGSSVVTNCTQSSTPFRDGKPTCLITDDDASAVEYIHQDVDITALSTSSKAQIVVYARDASGTTLDIQIVESGGCTGSTIDFAAKTIDTAWKQYDWTYTVADGDCTTATVRIAPTDFASAVSTSTAQFVGQMFLGVAISPWAYAETTSASAVMGRDGLYWDISGSGITDGSGNMLDNTKVTLSWTPMYSVQPADGVLYSICNPNVSWSTRIDTSNRGVMWATVGGDIITTSALTLVPGTPIGVSAIADWTADNYSLKLDSTSATSTTPSTTTASNTYLRLGTDTYSPAPANQPSGYLQNVKVRR